MGRLKHPKMVDIKDILDENTRLPSLVAASAEKLLGLERLNRAYDKIVRDKESGSPENFFQLAARHLNLKLQLRPGDLENIPKKGPGGCRRQPSPRPVGRHHVRGIADPRPGGCAHSCQ